MKQFALILVCLVGVVVGCTPTEGEPVAVDRPTTLPTMTSEPWTIDLLINNSWRVVEAQVDGKAIDYPTRSLTRLSFFQNENAEYGVGLDAYCEPTGTGRLSLGQRISIKEDSQEISPIGLPVWPETGCEEVSGGFSGLLALATQDIISIRFYEEQLIFESQQGTLILEIDNQPVMFDTSIPLTAYP